MFARLWDEALGDYNDLMGLDVAWMALAWLAAQSAARREKKRPHPTDRGKGGVKRRVLTEARGLPVGLVPDGTNRHDVKLVESTLVRLPPATEAARQAHRAGGERGLCLAAGYDSKQVRQTLAALGHTAHSRPRGQEVQARKASHKARRWVVERTHSWLNRFRYLLIRWAEKPENYLAMLHFAWARITWYHCLVG